MKKIFKFSIFALTLLCVLSVGVKEVNANDFTINLTDGLLDPAVSHTGLSRNTLSDQSEFDLLNTTENVDKTKFQLRSTTPNRDLLSRYSVTVLSSTVIGHNKQFRVYTGEYINVELVEGYFIKSIIMEASNSTATFTPASGGTELTDDSHAALDVATFRTEPETGDILLPQDVNGFNLLMAGTIYISKLELTVYRVGGAMSLEESFERLSTLSSTRFEYSIIIGEESVGSTSMDVSIDTPLNNNIGFSTEILGIKTERNSSSNAVAINTSTYLRLYSAVNGNGNHIILSAEPGVVFTGISITANMLESSFMSVFAGESVLHESSQEATVNLSGLETDSFKIHNSSPSNSNSQVNITEIIVYYERVFISYELSEDTPAIRFGVLIPIALYTELIALPAGIAFGVEVGGTFIECETAPVRVDAFGVADVAGEFYQFSLVLTSIPLDELNNVLTCAGAIKVGDVITKAKEANHSFVSIAQAYLDTKADDPEIVPHLGVLRHIVKTYA